jgi:hypothetical protein
MRAILALTVVGAFSAFSLVGAMAQQTPKETPKETPATPPANQIDSVRTPTDNKGLTEYWTPERLRQAQPMPMPVVDPNKK